MADERYFIYHKDLDKYDFQTYNSKQQAEQKAREILEDDSNKVGTIYIGQLVAVARRQVVFDKD